MEKWMQHRQKLQFTFTILGLALFFRISVAAALTSQEIAQIALPSTVYIETQSGTGSGFVVGEEQVATNYHVIDDMVRGTAQLVGQTTQHTITSFFALDQARDLAVITVPGLRAPALPLGDSDTVEIGQDVYAVGNPLGLQGTFSPGIISAIRPEGPFVADEVFQMTAPISSGSSGGPVLDSNAEVIGIAYAGIDAGQNLNFAIPVNYLKELLATGGNANIAINPPNLSSFIYWTDYGTDRIQRANLDGSNVQTLVSRGLENPSGIAVDVAGGKMYWTDWGTDRIQRANLDGSNIETLVSRGLENPDSIAVDVAGGKMYWTDWGTDRLQRANLDGSNVQTLVSRGLENPAGIDLDVPAGKMYWTDFGEVGTGARFGKERIRRANLDGSNVQTLVSRAQGLTLPEDVSLAVAGGKMYWTDWGTDRIQRANLDGSNVQTLVSRGLENPSGIAVDVAGGKMYWTELGELGTGARFGKERIRRANLDGSNVQTLVSRAQGLHSVSRIAIGIPTQTAPPSVKESDLVVEPPTVSGNVDQSSGTTYQIGEVIATLPTGSWFPNVLSGVSFASSGGQITATFNNGGYITVGRTRYTCVASGGCRIEGRTVAQGTIEVSGTAPPPVSQSTLGPGADFTLSATVRNMGAGSAAATTLRYYRSTDSKISTSDTEVGTDSVRALGANESSAESINLTAPTTAGTYYYGACVDSVANESDSNNNCSSAVSITVEGSSPEPTTLTLISGDNQTGLTGDKLVDPFVVEVQDQYGDPMAGVSVSFAVTAGGGSLSDTSVDTDANGMAQSVLTLGSDAGTNTVEVSAGGIGTVVTFNAVAVPPLDIPDANLRAAIEKELGKASGATITTAAMANLTRLEARNANISDLTGLEHAINLERLDLGAEYIEGQDFINSNSISDISPVADLTNLTFLDLWGNSITDISAVSGLTNLTFLDLWGNSITDISAVSGLTNLTRLSLSNNAITDISAVSGLTNLRELVLRNNNISDITAVSGLTNLPELYLQNNNISDISAVSSLTNLTTLWLWGNSITDISAVSGLTNLRELNLGLNSITDISAISTLTKLEWLELDYNNISDLSPLVANTGLGTGDTVYVGRNPLNYASIHTHIPALQRGGVEVHFEDLKPPTLEYQLSIPKGLNLIHVPLKAPTFGDEAETIESVSDLYNALGGASKVLFLATYDSQTQQWEGYFGPAEKNTSADRRLADDTGILANMIAETSVHLTGKPLGTNGTSTITLTPEFNVVGLPLRNPRINRVSDLLRLDGIRGNVDAIIFTDEGDWKLVTQAGDPSDIPIVGGQAFMLYARREGTVTISGQGWDNIDAMAAAPPVDLHSPLTGIQVTDTTSVLGLKGSIVDEGTGLNKGGFRVTVKNLSTGKAVTAVTGLDKTGYRHIIVDIETKRAATVGDILEISAQSPNPFIGVEPLRYTVTAEDVKRSLIELPELVAYEIPAETELLANYPNPFNPETWIPYRLAEDAFVTLTIYDGKGRVVRTLYIGHRIAAVYESRSKAVYWDGRNEFGETVASGVYFYHLSTGDFSATRKMLILK